MKLTILKSMRVKLLVLIVMFFGLLLSPIVQAQSDEFVSDFNSSITITPDNRAFIIEQIEYDFGSNERHGIERFIPTTTKTTDGNQVYNYDVSFVSAERNGATEPAETYTSGDHLVYRIGDPDATISGLHTYEVSYVVTPVIEQESDNDFLNWNITGNDWNVPILRTQATITFQNTETLESAECYSGERGSTNQSDCNIQFSGNEITLSNDTLLPAGSGVTVNTLMPSGTVDNYLVAEDPPSFNFWPLFGPLIAVASVAVAGMRRLGAFIEHKNLQKDETVVPQYEPPEDLTPGEVGQLTDNTADITEITATLIGLAVKGYMKIEQTSPKKWFSQAKYSFHSLKKADDSLQSHEKTLLELVFPSGTVGQTKKLKDVSKTSAVTAVDKAKKSLKELLELKGYYKEQSGGSGTWKNLAVGAGVLGLGTNVIGLIQGAEIPFVGFSVMSVVIGLAAAYGITRRTVVTESGYDKWAEVEGLKLYLQVAEKYRMQFHEAPDKSPEHFSELLPYAVALGVEKDWAKQFKDLDLGEDVGWYSGNSNITPAILASSLSSDFNSAVSSGFTPSQSSGGSGGSFSGGGGGGGGGGSW